MNEISMIIAIGIVINALVEIGKQLVANGKINLTMLITIVIGVVICIAYRLDILAAFGYATEIPFLGSVVTGICGSRLSNLVADWNAKNIAQTSTLE